MRPRLPITALLALFAFLHAERVDAATELPFLDAEIDPPLTLQHVDVTEAIATLMQRYDTPLRVATGEIEGVVSGVIQDVAVADWLSELGRIYGFYWYFDGAAIELGEVEDVGLDVLAMEPRAIDPFLDNLDRSGLDLSTFPIDVNRETGSIFVRGPESLQEAVAQIAETMGSPPHAPAAVAPRQASVRMIYGRERMPATGTYPLSR